MAGRINKQKSTNIPRKYMEGVMKLEKEEQQAFLALFSKVMSGIGESSDANVTSPKQNVKKENDLRFLSDIKANLIASKKYGYVQLDNAIKEVLEEEIEGCDWTRALDLIRQINKLEAHLDYFKLLLKAKKGQICEYMQKLFEENPENKNKCFFEDSFRRFGESKSTVKRYLSLYYLIHDFPALAFCGKNYYGLVEREKAIRKALEDDDEFHSLASDTPNQVAVSDSVLIDLSYVNL